MCVCIYIYIYACVRVCLCVCVHIHKIKIQELRSGIKIPERNINNFRHVDDSTIMVESEKELKSLLMRVKEESEKTWFKTQY